MLTSSTYTVTNIHILNFPMACMNIINGNRVRLFTMSGRLFLCQLLWSLHTNYNNMWISSCLISYHVSFNSFGCRFVGGISCGYTLLHALLFLDGSIRVALLPYFEPEDFLFSNINGCGAWSFLLSLPEMEWVHINVSWSLTSCFIACIEYREISKKLCCNVGPLYMKNF